MSEDAPFLTIGMACYDDMAGVYMTVTSLMLHHHDQMPQCEIIVVDNNPDSKDGKTTGRWVRGQPRCRYIPYREHKGTAQPREQVFRHARGRYVLCVDSHVMFPCGAIERLIGFYRKNPDTSDLYSGPLLKDHGGLADTHQRPGWGKYAYGIWSRDKEGRGRSPDDEPFEIWQNGFFCFTCRRDAWVGFHPQFRGFGGCETYVCEKFRQRGDKVVCLPFLRGTHKFFYHDTQRRTYPKGLGDRFRNYVIGFAELGLPLDGVLKEFRRRPEDAHRILSAPQSAPSSSGGPQAEYAVVADPQYGGSRLRGLALARHLDCKILKPNQVAGMANRETIIAVKRGFPCSIREKCERLIFDPLDSFFATPDVDPEKYWSELWNDYRFDAVIATSPACAEVMRAALPDFVAVHTVPHPADPKPEPTWRDPAGPVVYAGWERFIASKLDVIRDACRRIGREFLSSRSESMLKGASAALALRCAPFSTPIFLCCKPAIKIANAAAAGLPCVATDDPAITSLHPEVVTVGQEFTAEELAEALERAIEAGPLKAAYRQEDFLRDMDSVIHSRQEAPA